MNRNNLLYTVIFTFAATFFFVFFLSLADSLTAERSSENERISYYSAFLKAAGVAFDDKRQAGELFERYFPDAGPFPYRDAIRANVDGEDIVLSLFSGSGLWGTITGVIALSPDMGTVKGLEIISHNETPGLGGRIDETWFKEQFRGEKTVLDGSGPAVRVKKGTGKGADTDPANSEVEGITGASLTSASVEAIVDSTVKKLAKEAGTR